MFSSTFACRYCNCQTSRVSKFRLVDLPVVLLGFRPRRCVGCGKRVYVHRLLPSLQFGSPAA